MQDLKKTADAELDMDSPTEFAQPDCEICRTIPLRVRAQQGYFSTLEPVVMSARGFGADVIQKIPVPP